MNDFSISNARSIATPGWYDVTVTPSEGEPYEYTVAPDDDAEMAVAIRDMMADLNLSIAAFVPPSQEEVRAGMPPATKRQFRMAMLAAGYSSTAITNAILSIEDEMEQEMAMIEWEDATEFQRLQPFVLTVTGILGISAEQLDTIWNDALSR